MDPLTFLIVKALASTFLKFYLTSLLSGGALTYSKAELGYKVPKWYMNPGRLTSSIYSYGTSVEGDEFQSIEISKNYAVKQMTKHIRLGNQRMVKEKISFDRNSIKQQRLVDLFIRGDGLEDFVLMNVTMDKKQLVKTSTDEIRAFVRLKLKADKYFEYQEENVQSLKSKIVHQKTDDILEEMDKEIEKYGDKPFSLEEIEDQTPPKEVTTPKHEPAKIPDRFLPPPLRTSLGGFGDLENELDASSQD
jgi:hypothetical protein